MAGLVTASRYTRLAASNCFCATRAGPSCACHPRLGICSRRGCPAQGRACRSQTMAPMNIPSLQSHVGYGHVGNAAAMFALQRIGVGVWPIHTVQFSNRTGYGSWKGRVFDAGMIGDLMAGIEQRGVLGECDGVLSGYMGSADIGAAILDAVATVKRANPSVKYICDPVVVELGRG